MNAPSIPGLGRDPEEVGRPDPAHNSLADQIAEALAGAGVAPTSHLIEALEDLVIEWAIRRAAEHLRDVALRLDGTPTGAVFRRVILGDNEDARAAGARVGRSHTAILKASRKLQKRLGVSRINNR